MCHLQIVNLTAVISCSLLTINDLFFWLGMLLQLECSLLLYDCQIGMSKERKTDFFLTDKIVNKRR